MRTALSYADACAQVVAGRLAGRGMVKLDDLAASLPNWPRSRVLRAVRTLHEADRVALSWRAGSVVAVTLLEDRV